MPRIPLGLDADDPDGRAHVPVEGSLHVDVDRQTARCVSAYLRTHAAPGRPSSQFVELRGTFDVQALPTFLVADDTSETWLVRWPSGAVKWETKQAMIDRGFTLPDAPIVAHGRFTDPRVGAEVRARLEAQGRG